MNTWEEVEQQPEFGVLSPEDKASIHRDWHESVLNSLAEEDPEKVDAAGVNRFVATEKARNESLKTGQPFDDQAAQQDYAQQVGSRVGAQKQTMADLDELERAQFALKDAAANRGVTSGADRGMPVDPRVAEILDRDRQAAQKTVDEVSSRFTPEQLQQAKEAKAALNGERPTAVLGSDLYTDPALVLDKDKYRAAVAESDASPEAKARAMADFTIKRKQVAEQALRVLRVAGESPLPGALDFPSWEATQSEEVRKLPPEDKALQYMRTMQGRGDFRKLTSAIGTGLLQGGVDTASQGLGVAAMVANSGELAKQAAEVSEGASTLEEVGKLEGDKQATGATTAGGAARLLTPMAAAIAPAVLTGGGSLPVAAGLSGLQTAGAQFPTTYKALIDQGVPEEQALTASRNAAITSGLITTALTAAFGKTGAEAALLTGQGGKELVKNRLLTALKGAAKGSAAEIPEELLDEAASQVIEQRTIDPNKPVSQIVDEFSKTAPDLAMQIALLGGVGGGVGGYRGSTTTPGGAPTVPVPGTTVETPPDNDFARRAVMEGATEFRPNQGTPVQVEGTTIAHIPEGSPLTPEDVAEFAAEPDTMKMMARQGLITLPEIVTPVPGVDPAITEEMNENIATSAALAPQTVEALKAVEAEARMAKAKQPILDALAQEEQAVIPEKLSPSEEARFLELSQLRAKGDLLMVKDWEELGALERRQNAYIQAEGAARNVEVLREAAARLAGTEKGPDLGFAKVSPVTTATETPSNAANVAGGSQSVQTEPAEGSIPAVTGDTVSTSDIASTAEIQPRSVSSGDSAEGMRGIFNASREVLKKIKAGSMTETEGARALMPFAPEGYRENFDNFSVFLQRYAGWDYDRARAASKPLFAAEIQPTQANEPTSSQPNEGLRDEPATATEGARAGEQGQAPGATTNPVQREQPQVTNNVVVLNPADLEVIPEDLARAKENQKAGNDRWKQAAASTEPISVLQLPDGRYRILDGHHRALNAIAKGEQIQAIVEKPWAPAVNEPAAFTATNGQKVVGTVSHIAPNGKATVNFIWNGKDTSVSVPTSQLSRPITSLADGPKYVMTQEQNTRKAGKHFPTAPGVHENFDFNKAFASMAEDTSLSKMYREVARLLSKLPGFGNVDLHVVADGRKRYAGEYSHHNGKSAIAVNLRQVARGNVDALGTILHEALHHLTMAKVHNPQGDVELDAVAAIHQLRQKAEKFAKDNGQFDKYWYEFSNNDEFLTGVFTRPDFQSFLASIPDSSVAGKFRSILSEVVRRIAELLTGKHVPAGSTLEQSIASTLALFETPYRAHETGGLEKLSAVRSELSEGATPKSMAEDEAPRTYDVGGEAEPADGKGKQLYQKNPTAIGSTYTTPADVTLQEKKTQEETLATARTIIGESVKADGPIKGRRAALDRFRLDTNIPPEVRAAGTGLIAQQTDILANLEEGNQQLLLDEMTDEAAKLSGVIASDPDSFKNLKADANLNIDKMAEEAGRTLNIFNVFRRLTPEGFLRRMTRKYNDAVREKVEQNFDVPVEKVESEIALLRRLARESTSPERRKAILAAIKAYQQHGIDAKKLIEALFPQAGFRDRMNKGGEALVRNFFQMMAGPRDGKGPLAEFDETIQGALSSMLRKVMEAQGLVAKNESNQMTDIDKMVRAVSGDELRFDKIAAADEAMQKELADIKDPERRAVLQQAWEEATSKMFTNIASDATVRRAINAELKSANVDWTKMFDANQKPAAIRTKVVNAVMGKIEALLTDPTSPTVQNNLGMLRDEVGAAFDFIADNKRTQWLAQREAVEARRRVAEHRAAFKEALRNQGVAEQAINRISDKLAGPQRGKPDHNPVSALVGEHMKKEVPDFVDKMVALDVDRATAEELDKAASTLRTEIAAAEKIKAADRAVKELMKSLKPKPRAPREKIEKSLRVLFTADTVGALDDQAFFDAFGEAFGLPPLSDEQQTRIKKLVREINSMPKGPARLDKQQDLDEELALWKGIAARDVLLSAWYANILSGVSTQGMGMLGNLLNFVPRSLFNAIANPRSAGAYFKGALGEGLSTGIEEAKAALKGRGLYKVSKYGDKNLVSALELLRKKGPSTLPEWIAYIASAGTRLRYVFRIMQAIDALAWNTAREGHAYLAAHRALLQQEKETGQKRSPEEFYKAFIDGLGGDTAQIEEDLRDARQKLIDAGQTPSLLTVDRMARETRNARRTAAGTKGATRFADRIVLQQDPEGSGKFLSSLIDVFQKKGNILGLPVGQMLIPFNKIVSNLFEQSLDYTPVGALRAYLGGHLSDVKGINGKGHVEFKEGTTQFDPMERRERAMAATAGMAAAAIMYALAHAYKDEPDEDVPFMVYGWGPESKNKRAQMPKGWVPYSVKIGDRYVKFSEMPFGMMFAAAGSAMDAMRYKNMDKKTASQRLAYILKTSVKGFMNQGVMSSLDTAMETMMFDASEKKMADIPVNAVKGFIPAQGLLRDISTIMDPDKVSKDSLTSALLRDIPFAKGLATKPELNVFGEPIKMDGYPILRRITTHREPHAVADYLGRNDLSIPGMEQTVEIGKYLPDQMQDRIQRRAVELGAMENGLFTPEQNYEFKKRAGQLTKAAVENIMSQAPKITNDAQRKHVQSLIDKRVEVARRRAMLEAVPAQ